MAASVCDCLSCFQEHELISGDFLEIGAWKGKSAGLWGVHLSDQEALCLIDTTSDREAIADVLKRASSIRAIDDELKIDITEGHLEKSTRHLIAT